MPMWNPWRGCKKCNKGCLHCYIHNCDAKRGVDICYCHAAFADFWRWGYEGYCSHLSGMGGM